jgi:hypothetical protein
VLKSLSDTVAAGQADRYRFSHLSTEGSIVSLADRCKPDISAADWRKGGDYCLTGAVRKIKLGNTSLVAKVFGTSRYTVTFDWSRAEGEQLLQVDCTCPRFAEMGICKHVAATIRQVDREGLDHMIPGRGLLRVAELQGSIEDEFEEAELEYAGDDEFDDDEEWDPYDDESDAPTHRQPGRLPGPRKAIHQVRQTQRARGKSQAAFHSDRKHIL